MTDDQLEELGNLWRLGMPVRDIADLMGYTYSTIMYELDRHRDLFPQRRKQTPEKVKRACVARIRAGKSTIGAEAKELGVAFVTVYRWVKKSEGE